MFAIHVGLFYSKILVFRSDDPNSGSHIPHTILATSVYIIAMCCEQICLTLTCMSQDPVPWYQQVVGSVVKIKSDLWHNVQLNWIAQRESFWTNRLKPRVHDTFIIFRTLIFNLIIWHFIINTIDWSMCIKVCLNLKFKVYESVQIYLSAVNFTTSPFNGIDQWCCDHGDWSSNYKSV